MKKLISSIAFMLIITIAGAQTSITSIQFSKTVQPALMIELPSSSADVEGTILQKLKEVGYQPETKGSFFWKNNKTDGFYIFNNVSLPSMGTQKLDMYFKVVPKNKEEVNSSRLYMLVSTGNENFASPEKDAALWSSADAFLGGFTASTTAYSLEQDITKQESLLIDSRKKMTSLQNDAKEMEDKVKSLQADLIKNQNSQAEQQAEMESKQKSIDILKLKRKA